MINRWNDADAKEYAVRYELRGILDDDIIRQAYATTLFGADNDLTMHGGGNTSIKTSVVDSEGMAKRALYVKASGTPLNLFVPDDFVVMGLDFLESLRTSGGLDDETMAQEFKRHQLSDTKKLPSIESLMHAFVPAKIVSHTHPAALLKIVNRVGGAELLKECFGDELAVVPYARMGFDLANAVSGAMREYAGSKGVVMRHHGLIAWGETPKGVYDWTIEVVTKAEEFLEKSKSKSLYGDGGVPPVTPPPKTDYAKTHILKPSYAVLSEIIDYKKSTSTPCVLLDTPDVMELICSDVGKDILCDPPLTPDYPMYARIRLLWVDDDMPVPAIDDLPLALVYPKSGVLCYGADDASARKTADFVRQALSIRRAIFETGGVYECLAEEFVLDMQYRAYQQAKAHTDKRGAK